MGFHMAAFLSFMKAIHFVFAIEHNHPPKKHYLFDKNLVDKTTNIVSNPVIILLFYFFKCDIFYHSGCTSI